MVDLDWKLKIVSPKMSDKSAKLSIKSPRFVPCPEGAGDLSPACPASCYAYEQYLRLPELSKLWRSKEFPKWKNETLLRPALQALEITFRFISIKLSDPRPYANIGEWKRRLESLTVHQIELIAALCEEEGESDTRGTAPMVDLSTSNGVLVRDGSSREVWKLPGATPVVSRTSEASLLPRLATWQKSEDVASKIFFSIECFLQRSPFTLGLGEPNLAGKPILEYDLICKPSDLHALKNTPLNEKTLKNYENQALFTTHQILESWIFTSQELLIRIGEKIDAKEWEKAASDCYLLERIWKLLAEIEDLHLLMDPDDFLRLKNQLSIKTSSESGSFCFRSKALLKITKSSKDLKHKVPAILGVEVDPNGGPRIQEAVMKLFHRKGDFGKIHLLQAFQATESAVKRFFFSYQQVIVIVMGSLEAKGNRSGDYSDLLSEIFLEPPYYPSLDAEKTFLGDIWQYEQGAGALNSSESNGRARMNQ